MSRWIANAKRPGMPVVLGMALSLGLVGLSGAALVGLKGWKVEPQPSSSEATAAIATLALTPTSQRSSQLETLAQQNATPSRQQARYLLAIDTLQQGQATEALKWLENLETDYPVMAAPILVQRAKAYTLAGQTDQATATWQQLLQQYPKEPEAAAALKALGEKDGKFWDRAIAQFPAHPRTIEIVQARLKQNPRQPQLLLHLARHALYLPDITQVLDRLTQDYAAQLQPQDWAAIAFGYWETQNYGQAGAAYARAPKTALNAYRAGRGWQLGGKNDLALAAYRRMVAAFPQAKETPTTLIKLASLEPQPAQALQDLDRAVQVSQKLGDKQRAGEALLAKANLLVSLNNPAAAEQVRQQLLTAYSGSDAAAEWRWQSAEVRAQAQDYATAQKLAQAILTDNPDSELAPEAAFWLGKWARQSGQTATADQAFQTLWQRYPDSYYAWRAASVAGWPVGTFTSVRNQDPQVQPHPERLSLTAGSATLQELYRLGQQRDAWERWQWEFNDRVQPSFAQQLTDGLLRLGVSDHLDGIFMLANLEQRSRQEPDLRPLYQQLRQQPGYWQALYPLSYLNQVQTWAEQRDLNPLLVLALMRQESRFEPQIRSIAGAVGLMQVMPETGDWIAGQLDLKQFSLDRPDDNIKLGTWYLDYTHRTYSGNSMLAIASYNAGPGNVDSWVAKQGLGDPDAFIETIPFSETKHYVEAVFENYWNYLRLYNPEIQQLLQQRA